MKLIKNLVFLFLSIIASLGCGQMWGMDQLPPDVFNIICKKILAQETRTAQKTLLSIAHCSRKYKQSIQFYLDGITLDLGQATTTQGHSIEAIVCEVLEKHSQQRPPIRTMILPSQFNYTPENITPLITSLVKFQHLQTLDLNKMLRSCRYTIPHWNENS